MSISVDVYLLSGKCASMEVEADASVESLQRRAQIDIGVYGRGQLPNSSREVLHGAQTSKNHKLMSGDVLTLHVNNQVQLQAHASGSAFAAILGDGSVVAWCRADRGGDSSAVQDQLRDVQQIQASFGAFAAILGDGSVVAWAVQDQLLDVRQIQTSTAAFAAILGDGSVVS